MKIIRITKRFSRKISYDYKSWEFLTELTADVNIEDDKELEKTSKELFAKTFNCTLADMKLVAEKENKEETL